jgi:N6-L-threonylcarbamoyladenine synthase
MNKKIVLGIETSCDDTSICLLKETTSSPEILAHVSFTQEEILKKWGGVVPEIAAREHLLKVTPLLQEAFSLAQLKIHQIDLIGVTALPGLLGPLLTGMNAAKTIALLAQKPIVAVNHLYAHMEAIHLTEQIKYPYLGLLISGGHSVFFWVTGPDQFEVLGSTIDDAAGEAFDKGGKLMGLGYPAGKIIDSLARFGDPTRFEFPIGLHGSRDARMSFSGLKTALRVVLEKNPTLLKALPSQYMAREDSSQIFYDLCASYQNAIVNALIFKTKFAKAMLLEKYKMQNFPLVIGGGVACNSTIRETFTQKYKNVHFVKPIFCTDNGAMVANFALRNLTHAHPFPSCLGIDARGRFIDKKDFN